jgi:hypothetical protein
METRNIVNHAGEIIGQMSKPDGTSEQVWAEALAPYATAPVQPTLSEIIAGKVSDAIKFGTKLIIDAAVENIAMGITQSGKTKAVSDYLRSVQSYLREGSLHAAIAE